MTDYERAEMLSDALEYADKRIEILQKSLCQKVNIMLAMKDCVESFLKDDSRELFMNKWIDIISIEEINYDEGIMDNMGDKNETTI